MRKINFVVGVLALILSTTNVSAETRDGEYQKHEFSVGILGGMHALKYDMAVGKSSNKFAGGIGVGYTYFFQKNIGLATGFELAFYNADIKLNDFSGSHTAFDIDLQKDFEFRYSLMNYTEQQNAFYINVPILFHYQFTDGEKVKFYGAAGTKIGIPVGGKYNSSGANLKTEGYYPHDNSTIDDIKFRGFGNFVTKPTDHELSYKMAFSVAVEAGAKWILPKEMALYTGVYLDYGLNDVKKTKKNETTLIQYNAINPEDHIFAGVANSSFKAESGSLSDMADKIKMISYGVKIRLAFGR